MSDDALRLSFAQGFLEHVPFEGVTLQALERAAEEIEIPVARLLVLFPEGLADVIEALHRIRQLHLQQQGQIALLADMRVRDRIAFLVMESFLAWAPYKEAFRRLVTYQLLPSHLPQATRHVYEALDLIWRLAGDTSTDYDFYTKRTLLAGVYLSTLTIWLQDSSEGYAETQAFLARRIDEAITLPTIPKKALKGLKQITHGTKGLMRLWLG